MFYLQVLGAVAQLERALIADRSKAGLASARARGRVGGNPGVRAGDPAAIAKIVKSMDETYVTRLWSPYAQITLRQRAKSRV